MRTRKRLLRSVYVLLLIALWIVVDRWDLSHFFTSGIVGGLGATIGLWLVNDRAERLTLDETPVRSPDSEQQ